MAYLRAFLFTFSFLLIGAQAQANCIFSPHGFDCQEDVLTGSTGGGKVTPLIAWPQGTRNWMINNYATNVNMKPAVATLIDPEKKHRTCGVTVSGRQNIRIQSTVNGSQITVRLSSFLTSGDRVFTGVIGSDNFAELEGGKPFVQSSNKKNPHVKSLLHCSVFDRVKVDHLSCALMDLRQDGSALTLGITGSLPVGKFPSACRNANTQAVVM